MKTNERKRPPPWILCTALRLAALCLLFPAPAARAAEDIEQTILQLSDDDFDKREEATERLADYPAGFARVFLKLAGGIKSDPEIKTRLVEAAKRVFERSIGSKDERWLNLHAHLGMTYQMHYTYEFDPEANRAREAMGMAVSIVDSDGPASGLVRTWDLIVAIDGADARTHDMDQLLRAGKFHELTIKRYASADVIKERGAIDPDDKKFEVVKVKVKAAWKGASVMDSVESRILMDKMWAEFLDDYNNPASRNLAAAK